MQIKTKFIALAGEDVDSHSGCLSNRSGAPAADLPVSSLHPVPVLCASQILPHPISKETKVRDCVNTLITTEPHKVHAAM